MPLQSVDDIRGGHGLPAGVLCVGDSVSQGFVQELLDDLSGLSVDASGDPLDSASAGEPADRWGADPVEHTLLPVAAPLVLSASSFSSFGHFIIIFGFV